MFILFINIPRCQKKINMDIAYYEMSSKVFMKNYYGDDNFYFYNVMGV
jgi:hypothetical protein